MFFAVRQPFSSYFVEQALSNGLTSVNPLLSLRVLDLLLVAFIHGFLLFQVFAVHVMLILKSVEELDSFTNSFFVEIALEDARVLLVVPHPGQVRFGVCLAHADEIEERSLPSVKRPVVRVVDWLPVTEQWKSIEVNGIEMLRFPLENVAALAHVVGRSVDGEN